MLRVSAAPAQDHAVDDEVEAARELGVPDEAVPLDAERAGRANPLTASSARASSCATARRSTRPAWRARCAGPCLAWCAVHEHTRVTRSTTAWLETEHGRVRAKDIVVAVNAAAAGWKPLRRHLTTFGSYVVLTEPVPELLEQIGWTGGEAVFDGRMFLHYFRTTNDGRVLMGSGSGPIGFGGRIDARFTAGRAHRRARRAGPAAPAARPGGRARHPRVGRADRRLLRPPAVLRHGARDAHPLRRRLLGPRRRPELARRPDPGAAAFRASTTS